ncbi:hypothetical protein GCM10023189_17850 [Nibrella saemangeumensis]|uniref:FecR family protein n=1 Tax=Nibrella saemangeumensis TaxID=1084526 RepID=A0ABP8MR93_9BACT
MEADINKELIFNHFARKSSPLQRELIAQWLREKENEEQYYRWLEEWEAAHPQYLAQTQPALAAFSQFLAKNPHTDEPVAAISTADQYLFRQRTIRRWFVAASILLLLGMGGFLMRDQLRYHTYATSFGETRSIRLADGSDVVLNANSRLRVPRWGFGRETREVLLKGEALFSVTHTADDQKFIVKTERKVDVVVLGTEFTVFARNRGARVALNKGKVEIHYQQNNTAKQVTMKPGDLVSIDSRNQLAHKTTKDPQEQAAWRQKRFVFEETTLQEVAYLLEENYGIHVDISDSTLAQRKLMGSFRAENVDQLLQSISELLDITVVRQGNHVRLSDQ